MREAVNLHAAFVTHHLFPRYDSVVPVPDDFEIIDDTGPDEVDIDSSDDSSNGQIADRLDTRRIQRLSKLRRANNRSRSYALIVMAAAAVGVVQVGWSTAQRYRATGMSGATLTRLGITIMLSAIMMIAGQAARRIRREMK